MPSCPETQPVSPHRAASQLPLSLDGGLSPEAKNDDIDIALIHPNRVSNLFASEKTLKIKINFPKSNDKVWTEG
jgi:hypothetical protein